MGCCAMCFNVPCNDGQVRVRCLRHVAGYEPINELKEKRMIKSKSSAVIVMGMLSLALAGCQPKEGPAEKAGKAVDQSISNAGAQIEKAGDKLQGAARDAQK